jgi:hypothetical protein
MNSTAFSLSSENNSKINRNRITFGAIDIQLHPPTLAPVFANLDQEIDLTIGSFNFCVGSLGHVRLSEPVNSGPSTGKTTVVATSKTLVGSSNVVNSPVSIKSMESKESIVKELDEIMENLDLEESSGYSDMASDENLDNISNYSEEDFMACYGNVSGNSEDTWRSGLKLHNDEHTVPSSGLSRYDRNRYQLCIIINDTSKEFDAENNSIMNSQNLDRGAKHRAEGETESAVTTRDKAISQRQNGRLSTQQ